MAVKKRAVQEPVLVWSEPTMIDSEVGQSFSWAMAGPERVVVFFNGKNWVPSTWGEQASGYPELKSAQMAAERDLKKRCQEILVALVKK